MVGKILCQGFAQREKYRRGVVMVVMVVVVVLVLVVVMVARAVMVGDSFTASIK